MTEKIEINAGDFLTPVILTDGSGTRIGAAFINMQDIRIPARVTEIIDYMKTIDVDGCDYDALYQYNEMLEDKFCRLFGYDCRKSLFGVLSPTTTCGKKYAAHIILEKVMDALSDEIKQKAAERTAKISQYVRPQAE